MILGIDFGITTTDVALMEENRLLKAFYLKSKSLRDLKKALFSKGIDLSGVGGIAVTGGIARKKIFGKRVFRVGELNAIGFGGAFLSGAKKALVVSMGTGTCIVSFNKGEVKHVGGTPLGGGTIVGLSKKLLGESQPEKLQKLASKGSLHSIDLSVRDAIGSGIGIIPGNATASNFAKKGIGGKADLALAVQNMVAESNAVIAALAARSSNHRKIVFVGKTPLFPAVRRTLKRVLRYYGFSPVFPGRGEHAMAVGAAVVLANRFK